MASRKRAKRTRYGIFGGTFDPPHVGHLILADEARYQLDLDRILWVLTPCPPHKTWGQITSVEQRLILLEAALGGNAYFEINTTDVDRPPPHYAVDTLVLLRSQNPHAELVYLMGGDSLDDLPNWHNPAGFISAIDQIGVMRRPGEFIDMRKLQAAIPRICEKVEFLNAPFVEISSSHIRERVAENGAFRFYLPESVYRLVLKLNLYNTPEES